MSRVSYALVFLFGALAGCTTDSEGGDSPADSMPTVDAAPIGGTMAADMMVAREMGSSPEDMGAMSRDEGTAPADRGVAADEGVPVIRDAGPRPEAGPPMLDMGSEVADVNPPAPDLGAPCTAAGDLMEEFPCCDGSMPVECSEFARNHCVPCDQLPRCLPCGDGVCDEGENVCNCDADCDFAVECFGNGQQVPNVEGAPGCCEGFEPIGCERPGAGGLCEPCVGVTTCSDCGNDICDPAENSCNCPADCEPMRRCAATPDCLGRDAPIRCPGVWRCDPDQLFDATERTDDGCSYACFMDLNMCQGEQDCFPGEACVACPGDACNGSVCMDPDSLE